MSDEFKPPTAEGQGIPTGRVDIPDGPQPGDFVVPYDDDPVSEPPRPKPTDGELFFGQLVRVAGDTPGKFVVCGIREGIPIDIRHVLNGPAEETLTALLEVVDSLNSTPGANVYVNVALMRADLPAGLKGSEEDVVGVLADVLDFDGKHNPATRGERVPLVPHMEIETSPGNFQLWWWFDRPYSVAEAKPVIAALAHCAGTDSTISCEHLFRVPDTLNCPTQKKIKEGRSPTPYRARIRQADFTVGKGISLEWFTATTPLPQLYQFETLPRAIVAKWGPAAFDRAATEGESTGGPAGDFDWDQPQPGTTRREVTEEALAKALDVDAPGRSEALAKAINLLIYAGCTPNETVERMMAHSDASAFGHYPSSGTEAALKKDVKRLFTKPNPKKPNPADRFGARTGEDTAKGQDGASHGRYRLEWPADAAKRPPISYFDNRHPYGKRILPRIPGEGCSVIAYGPTGSHKTGVIMALCLDAVLHEGANILFIALEGAHGMRTARLPKACQHHGIDINDLTGRWLTLDTGPNLLVDAEVDELITWCREQSFKPDIFVVDTLTKAIGGADINAPATGAGMVRGMERMARGFEGASGIGVTHPGKDLERGGIGSSLQHSLIFAEWNISKASDGRVWLEMMKNKDGPAEFHLPFHVNGVDGVPVISDAPPGTAAPKADDPDQGLRLQARMTLQRCELTTLEKAIPTRQLAAYLVGRAQPSESDPVAYRAWVTDVLTMKKKLQNARRYQWAKDLSAEVADTEDKLMVVWYLKEPIQPQ